jgi:hypothetical protein
MSNRLFARVTSVLLIVVCFVVVSAVPGSAFAAEKYSLTHTGLPVTSCDVTVIGDSVTLGAKYFGNISGRIAALKDISTCETDAIGSRGLMRGASPTGITLAKSLKKSGKLGKIVVLALATNHSYSYGEAKQVVDIIGEDRYVIFVTGYVKGHTYTLRSRDSALKIASERKNVLVADWYSVMKAHGGKGLSDDYCHLNGTSAKWYVDEIIKRIKEITAMAAQKRTDELERLQRTAALDTFGTVELVVGKISKSPAALYGRAAKSDDLVWSSSDASVVSVNKKGMLSPKSVGTAKIKVYNPGNKKSKMFKVNVVEKTVRSNGISLSATSLSKKALKINIATKAEGVTGVPTFASSDTKIATVSRSGVVTGKKKGTVKISVKYGGSQKSLTVDIK